MQNNNTTNFSLEQVRKVNIIHFFIKTESNKNFHMLIYRLLQTYTTHQIRKIWITLSYLE